MFRFSVHSVDGLGLVGNFIVGGNNDNVKEKPGMKKSGFTSEKTFLERVWWVWPCFQTVVSDFPFLQDIPQECTQ